MRQENGLEKKIRKTLKIVGASTVKAEDILSGKVASAFSLAEQTIPKRVAPPANNLKSGSRPVLSKKTKGR